MDKIIVSLFGVNRFNLFGWCAAGLLVIGLSVAMVVTAFRAMFSGPKLENRPDLLFLATISLLLLGIFGLLLQLYCSMLAEKLERRADSRTAD